jgi:hypothetical protein
LPPIGRKSDLWRELVEVRLSAADVVDAQDLAATRQFLSTLARPIILLHTEGSNFIDEKNLPHEIVTELYRLLLDETGGSLVLLDWDDMVPWWPHPRMRHIRYDWEHISLERLWCLMDAADLLIGVDSGPYHFAAFTDLPTIGVWRDLHPSQCTLPRRNTLNLVRSDGRPHWIPRRAQWNLVEYAGHEPPAATIAEVARQMLAPPRYLRGRENSARDAQFHQFIEWCRTSSSLSPHADRHTSLDRMLRAINENFEAPTIVQTGCTRAPEDWSAGYGTYLLAIYLARRDAGRLHCVDNQLAHIRTAEKLIAEFGERVAFHHADPVEWLLQCAAPIDVLYLDSLDVEDPRHADQALQEIKAAESRLHERSLVLIDDCAWQRGWTGRGAQAIPWLLQRGWQLLSSGYQVLLSKR